MDTSSAVLQNLKLFGLSCTKACIIFTKNMMHISANKLHLYICFKLLLSRHLIWLHNHACNGCFKVPQKTFPSCSIMFGWVRCFEKNKEHTFENQALFTWWTHGEGKLVHDVIHKTMHYCFHFLIKQNKNKIQLCFFFLLFYCCRVEASLLGRHLQV